VGAHRIALASDRGFALVEIAITVPLVLALTATCAWLLSLVAAKSTALHGAHSIAQQIARGVDPAAVSGPAGSDYLIRMEGGLVHVEVRTTVEAPGPILDALRVEVSATAAAVREPAW